MLTIPAALERRGRGGCVHVWTARPFWITSFIMKEPLMVPILMKCPSEMVLGTNILKLKCSPHVTSEHVQRLQLLEQSEFRPGFL